MLFIIIFGTLSFPMPSTNAIVASRDSDSVWRVADMHRTSQLRPIATDIARSVVRL